MNAVGSKTSLVAELVAALSKQVKGSVGQVGQPASLPQGPAAPADDFKTVMQALLGGAAPSQVTTPLYPGTVAIAAAMPPAPAATPTATPARAKKPKENVDVALAVAPPIALPQPQSVASQPDSSPPTLAVESTPTPTPIALSTTEVGVEKFAAAPTPVVARAPSRPSKEPPAASVPLIRNEAAPAPVAAAPASAAAEAPAPPAAASAIPVASDPVQVGSTPSMAARVPAPSEPPHVDAPRREQPLPDSLGPQRPRPPAATAVAMPSAIAPLEPMSAPKLAEVVISAAVAAPVVQPEPAKPEKTQETPAIMPNAGVSAEPPAKPIAAEHPVAIRPTPAAQIVDHVQPRLEQLRQVGHAEMQVDLHPPELGRVQLHLTLEDGRVNVRMTVQDEGARRLLDQQIEPLRVRFGEMGVNVGQFDVRRDGGSPHPQQQPPAEPAAKTHPAGAPTPAPPQITYGGIAKASSLVDLLA